jgi:tetratricopeptide (TPR) repeat protein
MIVGGRSQDSGRPRNPASPAGTIGVAARDPDFQACEAASSDDGIAACDRAIASGKFAGRSLSYLYSDRGFMRMQTGEIDRALADLDEAIRIDAANFFAFWNRGAVYTAKAEFDRAQADLTTALALKPDKTSKAQIEEALNVVVAAAKAVEAEPSDPLVITDPSKFWGPQQGVAGSAASSYPTDAMSMPAAPSMDAIPALPAAPPPPP